MVICHLLISRKISKIINITDSPLLTTYCLTTKLQQTQINVTYNLSSKISLLCHSHNHMISGTWQLARIYYLLQHPIVINHVLQYFLPFYEGGGGQL